MVTKWLKLRQGYLRDKADELKELEAKGYRARNARELWFSKELESLKRDLGLQR